MARASDPAGGSSVPASVPAPALLETIYQQRFDDDDASRKFAIWTSIGAHLQRFIPDGGAVVDIAADRGYFIKSVRAAEKWATDLRDLSADFPPDIRFVQASGLELDRHLPNGHFDLAFMSNYLEHLPGPDAVIQQFRAAREILKPGGVVMVLQPNIRLVGGKYWDFIDHSVALTEKSMAEAAEIAGLRTVKTITRFLPYTTKGRMPSHPLLVKAYLKLPPAWLLFGKQTLYLAERPR